jgi:hypothetical protein
MRGLALVLATGTVFYVGCSGDSSALMSVWNDDAGVGPAGGAGASGVGGATGAGYGGQPFAKGGSGGGYGGQPFVMGGSGGSDGSGGSVSGGVVSVPGGTRDLATAQCISTSGGTCPVSGDYLACLRSSCGANLSECYYSDGYAKAVGGDCRDYANCMLHCSCDAGRSACEDSCLQNLGLTDSVCSTCLFNLWTCTSLHNCPPMAMCSTSAYGGSGASMGQAGAAGPGGAAGAAGASGSTTGFPPTPVDAGPIIKLDASPIPRDARGFELYVVGPPVDGGSFWFPEVGRPDGSPIPTDLSFLRPELPPPNLP